MLRRQGVRGPACPDPESERRDGVNECEESSMCVRIRVECCGLLVLLTETVRATKGEKPSNPQEIGGSKISRCVPYPTRRTVPFDLLQHTKHGCQDPISILSASNHA